MTKQIIFGNEARSELQKGINILANAVGCTLGPNGGTVMIDKDFSAPHITKDGYNVARDIELKNPFQNMGAQLLKEVSAKVVEEAGDGTTTSTVLAQQFLNGAFQQIDNLSLFKSPKDVKLELDEAVKLITKAIKEQSKPCGSFEELEGVATISANGDKVIGNLVATAIEKVGKDGIVVFEPDLEDSIDFSNGINFDRAGINQHLAGEFDNASVFVSLEPIDKSDIMPVLEKCVKAKKPLVIVAPEYLGDLLQILTVNVMQNGFKLAAIKNPGFGKNIETETRDLAAALGTVPFEKVTEVKAIDCIGEAGRVEIDNKETRIIEPKGDVAEYVKTIDDPIRKAFLTSGVATIKIGALSEAAYKERFDRYEDALCACKAALEEGIVVGGGKTLANIDTGVEWINKAISKPFEIIGETDVEVYDPAKVSRCAVEYAASVAGAVILTECLITDEEDDE